MSIMLARFREAITRTSVDRPRAIAATGVTVVNATTITATTAAHAAGAVDVTVFNADGQSNTLVGAYTYVATASVVAFDSVGPGATGAGR